MKRWPRRVSLLCSPVLAMLRNWRPRSAFPAPFGPATPDGSERQRLRWNCDILMPAPRRVRLGVIGVGAWAVASHLLVLAARADEVEFVAVSRIGAVPLAKVQRQSSLLQKGGLARSSSACCRCTYVCVKSPNGEPTTTGIEQHPAMLGDRRCWSSACQATASHVVRPG
jgi:hypothetical protein